MEHTLIGLADYEPFVGAETIERMTRKARALHDRHITHVNATYYGGGVAEILSSLTLLMHSVGVPAEWRVLLGAPDFFAITKKMHNALQGGSLDFTEIKQEIYEGVIAENAARNYFDHDIMVIHDPQPLPLITHYRKRSPWIWRCHIDLSNPHPALWSYLKPFIERYDAVILSIPEFAQPITPPQVFCMPAIDPFTPKNRAMSDAEMDERLAHYHVPTDRPLIVQVSRFDPWKDPQGVIRAFKLAQREIDATLVLLGNFASDDPEGIEIFEALQDARDDRILILPDGDDTALVNTLQRRAALVVQKSTREGFGLTVTEAMWKGTPVIGGNVGGIRYQIRDGENGFLVSSVEEAAMRMVYLIKHPEVREQMGQRAHETVRDKFLLSRLLEQDLDLFAAFETHFSLNL